LNSIFHLKNHFQAFRELISLLTRHRQLTWEMTKREISDRYAGQTFGLFWAIGHPLILMGVYVFIFALVFKMRTGGTRELPLDYTTYLLSGLIPWLSFQESMSKSSTVIVNNANLVKQVVFPIEILPVKGVIASFMTQLFSTLILVTYVFFRHDYVPASYSLLPILFFFQILAMTGVSYIFSSVGTYFRDLKDFVQVFSVVGVFLMPIFYLPAQVPKLFRPVLYLNPFSYFVWCYQDACYFGRMEHPWAWIVYSVGSVTLFYLGYRIFRKLKIMFGNII
jgi:lipopolysaccharide transport system permease protein